MASLLRAGEEARMEAVISQVEAALISEVEAEAEVQAKTLEEVRMKAAIIQDEARVKAAIALAEPIVKAVTAEEKEALVIAATAKEEAQVKAAVALTEAMAKAATAEEKEALAKEATAQEEAAVEAQVQAAIANVEAHYKAVMGEARARPSIAHWEAQAKANAEARVRQPKAKEKAWVKAAVAVAEAVAKASTAEEKEALVKAAVEAAEEAREKAAISPALVCDLATYKRSRQIIKNMEHYENTNVEHSPGPVEYSFQDKNTDNPHYQHYIELVKESEGYYIPKLPEGVKLAYIAYTPVKDYHFDLLAKLAKNALNWYNMEKKENKTYEFVKVECGSSAPSCGLKYRIAFIARDPVSCFEVPFRAVTCLRAGNAVTVEYCEKAAESCEKFTQLNGRCC